MSGPTLFEQTGRYWTAVISDVAREWAAGDPDKLAAAAFARLMQQHGMKFEWDQVDGTRFVVGWGWAIRAKACSTKSEHIDVEAFDTETPWVAYVNLALPPLAIVMGLTYRTEQQLPLSQLLTFDEWRRGADRSQWVMGETMRRAFNA